VYHRARSTFQETSARPTWIVQIKRVAETTGYSNRPVVAFGNFGRFAGKYFVLVYGNGKRPYDEKTPSYLARFDYGGGHWPDRFVEPVATRARDGTGNST